MNSESYLNEEEHEEEEDQYPEDDLGATSFGFGASSIERPSFSEDSLKYATMMGASPYLADIMGHIKSVAVTERYKRELISCVYSLFAREQVLANNSVRKLGIFGQNDPLKYVLIFAQLKLELTRCAATQEDMLSMNVSALEKNIMSVFEAYVSRSVGEKRERLINAELGTRNIQVQEVARPYEVETKAKKKSFWSFGR
ncbi:MAG: hypothetical protein M0R51_12475 [Clostridia bacterium]|jgi:hypothetical protein|nr:hypothetical protein [Clostridia bacterium]